MNQRPDAILVKRIHSLHRFIIKRRHGASGEILLDLGLAFRAAPADVVLWPFWDQVRCPTLLLRGADSDLLLAETAQEMTRRGPKARLVEFAGVGHAPMLMTQDQISVVKEFLKSDMR